MKSTSTTNKKRHQLENKSNGFVFSPTPIWSFPLFHQPNTPIEPLLLPISTENSQSSITTLVKVKIKIKTHYLFRDLGKNWTKTKMICRSAQNQTGVKIGTKPSTNSSEDWRKKQTSSKWMLIGTVSSTHQCAKNVQTTAPASHRDRLNLHPDRRLSVNPSPHRANPHPDRRRDRQPKPRRAHPSPDRRLSVNPNPAMFYPSYFFLSCYREQRENRE